MAARNARWGITERHMTAIADSEPAFAQVTAPLTEAGPGLVEAAVRRDLARLTGPEVGAQASRTEMAVRLARAIDGWDLGSGTASSLSAMAKAHQELRATLAALMEVAG